MATKELAVALRQRTVPHLFFTREFLTITNMAVVLHPPYFSVSLIEDKTKRPPF
jgi:hypothetical protein